jgi:hypothetical protein
MLSKKAQWWISKKFICMVVLLAAVILMIIAIAPKFWNVQICPDGQLNEILKVNSKVDEVKMQPGYTVVYFKMKPCAKSIKYDSTSKNVTVNYVTTGEYAVKYPTNADWDLTTYCGGELTQSGQTYTFYVYPDEVKCVGMV